MFFAETTLSRSPSHFDKNYGPVIQGSIRHTRSATLQLFSASTLRMASSDTLGTSSSSDHALPSGSGDNIQKISNNKNKQSCRTRLVNAPPESHF
jgi:hypothetical protein